VRVLVVDDEPTTALTVAAAISALGHEVLVARDGREALDVYLAQGPDVVLTDRQMPGMDGIELCRRIREDDEGHATYLILIAALGGREHALEGMEAGADDYLVKPVDPFDLRLRLLVAERVSQVHRELRATLAELGRANEVLQRLARTDRLTGAGNRLRFDEDLTMAATRARRYGRGYAVAMIDIDHFKVYNDTWGHAAGDEALQAVATAMATQIRDGDGLYRYGGEEFVVLLQEADAAGAAVLGERLRDAVERLGLPAPGPSATVTVSVGVAAWTPGSAEATTDVVSRADAALYRAKAEGRNRLAVADPMRG
jgi:two-component system, cell cycle response regulator